MTGYYLSLDAGTSGGKAVIIDENGIIKGFSKSMWSHLYQIPEDLQPYGHEFDPDLFWNMIIQDIRNAVQEAKIDPKEIRAITATSQRHGCVFLDGSGKEIYAGPNRDARGLEVDVEDYIESDELFQITGHGLPFIFTLARLLWFRENEEAVYEQIKHLLTIDGWLNYRLTGKYSIDNTAAAETLLFDINLCDWSNKIIDAFEIPFEILPEKLDFGNIIGSVLPEVSQKLGLSSQIPVIMSSADTQASLVGCGAIEPRSIGIVAGSTMPIQLIIDNPIIDTEQKIWTGAFMNNYWVLESNAGSAGDIHSWFVDSFLKYLEVDNPYGKFDQLVLSQKPGSNGIYADLGPQIFDAQNMLTIPTSGGYSFVPIAYSFDEPPNVGSFARALVENLSFAVKANVDQITNLSKESPENWYLVGGLSRSKAFAQVLSNVLNEEIKVLIPEGAALGGFVAAQVGLNQEANAKMVISKYLSNHIIFYPQEDQYNEYEKLYPQWYEIYQKNREEE